MQLALHPYATAGVAIVGASLIAVTPAAAPLPDVHGFRDVAPTADGSPLGDLAAPWIDQFNTAAGNATVLANNFYLAPGLALQQVIANQSDFVNTILNDTSTIPDVVNQMQENVNKVFDGFTLLSNGAIDTSGTGDAITEAVLPHTLSGGADISNLTTTGDITMGHMPLVAFLPTFLPSDIDPDQVTPIINFLSSPLSGILIGALGPFISPFVALSNSITDGDSFSEILANMVGAFYNGADLNLDSLIPAINDAGLLPDGTEIHHIDLALGGLLTPGDVAVDDNLVPGTSDLVPAPGGSILNSVGLNLDSSFAGFDVNLDVESQAVGPIGALLGWGQAIGAMLGDGWSGKSSPLGAPNPLPAIPPLSNFSLPHIPDDFFDDGGAGGAAADAASSAELTDLLDALGLSL